MEAGGAASVILCGVKPAIFLGILGVMSSEGAFHETPRSDVDSHDRAMTLPIGTVVRELVDLLGATTVAVIGGVQETRAVQQWMADREPQRPHVLRFALQIALMIATPGDGHTVQAWFHGSNPRLDDHVPMLLLRDRPLNEIQASLAAAARAFALRR
jgi:hypothetical protein